MNWITTEEEIEDDDDEADGDSDDVNKYISKDSLPLAVDFNKLMHQNLVANSVRYHSSESTVNSCSLTS